MLSSSDNTESAAGSAKKNSNISLAEMLQNATVQGPRGGWPRGCEGAPARFRRVSGCEL